MMPMKMPMNPQEEAADTNPNDAESPQEDAAAQKVELCITILGGDQYEVYGEDDEDQPHDQIQGKEAMLKAVLQFVNTHPVGGGEQAHMDAGYKAQTAKVGF